GPNCSHPCIPCSEVRFSTIAAAGGPWKRTKQPWLDVIAREIQLLDVRQERRGDDADDGTAKNVQRDDIARACRREQRCRDQRRRAAGEHRGELEADRGSDRKSVV